MAYATKNEIETAEKNGYKVTKNLKNGHSFTKNNRNVWSIRSGWQTADLVNGYYTNHKKYTDLIKALNRQIF